MAGATNASAPWTVIVHEVLRKDNYKNWSALVENYLVGQGLWDGVVEPGNGNQATVDYRRSKKAATVENNPHQQSVDDAKVENHYPQVGEEGDDDWRWKNAKALHAIQLACGPENLSNIRTFKTAREAWNHLKISFSEDVKAYPDIEQGRDHHHIYQLHSDVKRGYWNDAKSYIIRFPDSIFSTSSSTGRTVLHVAVAYGHEKIVKELVSMANERLLKMQDKKGYTALALAAELTDNKEVARWMVEKGGKELLTMKTKVDDDDRGEIPVLLASAKGHKQMTTYLFSITPPSVFFQDKDHHHYGIMLLTRCISSEIFGVAASLIQHRLCRDLPLANGSESEPDRLRPIYALAHIPSAFLSGAHLNWWQLFIYNYLLRLQIYEDPYGKRIKIVSRLVSDEAQYSKTLAGRFLIPLLKISRQAFISQAIQYSGRILGQFQQLVQTSILLKLPGFQKIYEEKVKHYLVLEILKFFRKRVSRLEESELHEYSVYDAVLQAAKYGINEFIDSMRLANPDLLWAMDKNRRGIFWYAILNRQEKVFQLIHEIEGRKEMIASREDVFHNNMLHLAAELGNSSELNSRSSNAALQMQSELHWFEAVERIVPPKCKEARNADGKKPRELFTKNHEDLVKAGEKWARDTATSFTIVGSLIITIMFAAAFTVPGGNDQNTGIPIFLRNHAFTVFIVADAISLITSSSSVLSFIWILTSRYAENDFRMKLPFKLVLGLMTLFFSVLSMMIAFIAALYVMLKGYRRVVIAVMSLSVIPILVLIPTLLNLSKEIIISTWRPALLTSKKKKNQE
ncbi:hypothetical protein PIB30_048056 [Stylosanthes scabra]|uniref:PGG domain-containing protein n=1 Tax=Stylosanthes scabra TaxID=79078 RepID=A0ABU6SH05_9FABA|nr:hypothetical protein [Stylosanthes scabra]